VPFYPQQIPHGLPWDRTQTSVVSSWHPPELNLNVNSYFHISLPLDSMLNPVHFFNSCRTSFNVLPSALDVPNDHFPGDYMTKILYFIIFISITFWYSVRENVIHTCILIYFYCSYFCNKDLGSDVSVIYKNIPHTYLKFYSQIAYGGPNSECAISLL
jgi:hypothetical protein